MGIEASVIGAIAAATAAAAGVAGTTYSIVAGEDAKKQQREAMNKQEAAQKQAAEQAASQQRRSEMAISQATRKTPDVSSIMERAQQASATGPSATMLTGPSGAAPSDMMLGRSTLLGG